MSGGDMQPHTRAIVAASAYAFITGRKVAGMYDHAAERHLRIAAEARDGHLQGYDGDRNVRFGGTLPEIREADDGASVHMEVSGATARGYDRGSSSHFTADVNEQLVQLHDHVDGAWFSFNVHVA